MKSKTITHIILEGCDGIGKDTICSNLWRLYDFEQRVYVRGEISDYVYAQKFNRRFISTQRGLPFLYVVLLGDKEIIKSHIRNRKNKNECLADELAKVDDNDLFAKAAEILKNDYHIITIDCGKKTINELVEEIYDKTIFYIESLSADATINEFNKLYKAGCDRCGIKLTVKNNQPFFDDKMIMADAHLHNGQFETFSDKTVPHNLIFSLAYTDNAQRKAELVKKEYDFCYPINSKILVRPEVYEYFAAFEQNQKSFLTTDSDFVPRYKYASRMYKCFGDDYIELTAKARATVYTARDLVPLKMITVRAYEATLANQIVFVDELSDPDNEILNQIYSTDGMYDQLCRELLRVNPNTICNKYNKLMTNESLVEYILSSQKAWYNELKNNLLHTGETKNE